MRQAQFSRGDVVRVTLPLSIGICIAPLNRFSFFLTTPPPTWSCEEFSILDPATIRGTELITHIDNYEQS